MRKGVDLLDGPIASSLAKLAFPIMGTSLIQMAYNLTDMIWIGRISSNAVAAVGAAGMYTWLSNGIILIPKVGGQVKVAQTLGAGKNEEAIQFAKGALQMGILFGILYGLLCVFCAEPMIGFFNLNSARVIRDANIYLMIVGGGVLFNFINQVLTGLMVAVGNSGVTFLATMIGLFINIIMDPMLIFGIGLFPRLNVMGAAIATIFAQMIVCLVYIAIIWKEPIIFSHIRLFTTTKKDYIKTIFRIGTPSGVQNMFFTAISMIIARLIAGWGDAAVAVQKVGTQIESISWMTAEGFESALNSFVAQNYGAKKIDRIKKGYITALGIMSVWGILTSVILIVFPQIIFRAFITEPELLSMGVDYLRILGISQLFMCVEITTIGAFQGIGKTMHPSVLGIIFTSIRIPLAMMLSATVLALNGIWWSITISSILKGLILPVWFVIIYRKQFGKGKMKRLG